jgi:hypothetical protein
MKNNQDQPSTDALEARAAEQRVELHRCVNDLRSTLREKLDVKKNAREHLGPSAGVAALAGLALGYALTGVFTD